MKSRSNKPIYCVCLLDGTMQLLGKKWVLFAINSIGNHGTIRFTDLNKELNGISPSTLSLILGKLEKYGVVDRKVFPEIPPRVEYSLTADGENLRKAIVPLFIWAAKKDNYLDRIKDCNPDQLVKVNTVI